MPECTFRYISSRKITSTNQLLFCFADIKSSLQLSNLRNAQKIEMRCGFINSNNTLSFSDCSETKWSLCNVSKGGLEFFFYIFNQLLINFFHFFVFLVFAFLKKT